MRDDDIILESEALVGITQKNVEDTIAFIQDGHYTAEMVDIPGDVYGRISGQVEEAAIRAMKKELKDGIYEDDQVVLQTVLPVDLLNLMPQKLLEKLDQDIINEVYEQVEEPEEDNARVVEFTPITDAELAEMEPDWVVMDEEKAEPNDKNTLYLTIRQVEFDKIVSGEKKVERREIKDTTFKKYLVTDAEGNLTLDEDNIYDETAIQSYDIYAWNEGVYPFVPKDIQYLKLAAGYNKQRDTALVQVTGYTFYPLFAPDGTIFRMADDAEGHPVRDENGNQCFWEIVFHLGEVIVKP